MKRIKFEYRISLFYVIIGGSWIIFSDNLVGALIPDAHMQSDVQTYKGWLYVIVTALLFFFFIRRHLKKLRKVEEEALESERLKSAFLANISHEIRTPMNGIIGFSDLLNDPDISEDQKLEYLQIIESSGKRLIQIIDNLVLLSRIDTGELKIENAEVSLNWLLEHIRDAYAYEANKKNIAIVLIKSLPDEKSYIFADESKLQIILGNLVKNAIMYSDKGTLEIGYKVKEKYMEFYVKDQGIGIPEDKKEIIFKRFIKAGDCMSWSYQGAGIGLSIARSLTEMMNGKIWVDSVENAGSTFYFTIPLHK